MAGLVIGALFILPYVLFSATSGQLADKLDKARLMRFVKSFEIAVMAIAGWGFATQQVAAGNLEDVLIAIAAGKAYGNVHTIASPGGEIRGQVKHDNGRHH